MSENQSDSSSSDEPSAEGPASEGSDDQYITPTPEENPWDVNVPGEIQLSEELFGPDGVGPSDIDPTDVDDFSGGTQ